MSDITNSATRRFDEAEGDVDRGSPFWRFREAGAPNPLTIEATGWSAGFRKLGEAEFLNGVDREGRAWSVLVGSVVLTKKLIKGLVEEWDSDHREFVVTATLGRVQPGEVVSIKFLGDREGAQYAYPNFKVSRKPAEPKLDDLEGDEPEAHPGGGGSTGRSAADSDIPFRPVAL
jgi:hypothetical protein